MRRHYLWCLLSAGLVALTPGPASATDYYVCACDTDAAATCVAGLDSNDGLSPVAPWQSYAQAVASFSSLLAGDSIRFCRGGAFAVEKSARWVNSQCRAAQPCLISDYQPAWADASAGLPIIWVRSDISAFDLEDGGDAEHEEGYSFSNLDLRSTVGTSNGFFLYNDIDDVVIDHVSIDGFGIGVQQAGSNPCNPADPLCDGKNSRLTLRNSRIVNNTGMGYLGAGDDSLIENCYFENNGTAPTFDHNIYLSGGGERGMTVRGNELYRSSVRGNGHCQATSLVVHGQHQDLTIERNLVREDVGAADPGCWGIAVDTGYSEAESFTNVVIRGNVVRNVGNVAIGTSSCVNCTIEDNVVIQEQDFDATGIAVPDRDRGAEDAEETGVIVRNNSIYFGAAGGVGIALDTEGTGHVLVSNAIHYAGTANDWSCLDASLPKASYSAIDYNLCYFAGSTRGNWEASAGSLAAWQTATGFDAHSANADPGFRSPAGPAWDLTALSSSSAMVDTGDPARSSPTDLWGNPRDSHPDMGAFEFGFAAPDGGPGHWDGGSRPDAGATGGKSSGCGCSVFP